MKMKVSVIIPTYNRPGYLAQAVHSVLQQTQPVFEIIIVDDGSLAKHRGRIAALKQLDGRISVYHFPENKGVSAARNYGLEKSGGDYILFLDDDDLVHPHMVESNLGIFAAEREAGVVSSGYDMFFDTIPPEAKWSNDHPPAISPETIICSCSYRNTAMLAKQPFSALLRNGLQVSSCLLTRQAIGPARFPEDLTRGEDVFLWLTLANAGCKFEINHRQLCFHRLHRYNSLSNPGWRKASLEYIQKVFSEGMASQLHDRLAVHLILARHLLRFDLLQCFKHLFFAGCILISFPRIPSWSLLVQSIPTRLYNKWQHRKVKRAQRALIAGEAYGSRQ